MVTPMTDAFGGRPKNPETDGSPGPQRADADLDSREVKVVLPMLGMGSAAASIEAGAPEDTGSPVPGLGLTALGPIGAERKARDWALVLQSMSIWHAARHTPRGWFLLVRDEDYARASGSIERYEVENRDWPPPRPRERLRHPASLAAPIVFFAMAAFFMVTGAASGGSLWFQRGASVADLVVSTQPWRAVTALTLHADGAHVMGNVISGSIFASAVHRRLGPGGGSLAILASGIAGNLANAFWHHASGDGGHGSIGASTAVFGAIGLLAATQFVVDRPETAGPRRGWIEIVSPLVGGLALLGALGASPRADLGAHLFGFVSGAVIGLFALGPARLLRKPVPVDAAPTSVRFADPPRRWWVQPLLGAIAAGVLLGAWQMAMPLRIFR
jgi:membrane associated rhomboid family serine protease